jgi:class 3 adenylate cyclase/tetratricopeptide (TPR) repeat protein
MACGASLERSCASCGASLPENARFCIDCGTPVAIGADERPDSASREPRAYTPRHLADKILRSRGAMEGERKQVTVLFADVRESMDLAGRVDPETWHEILDGFFAILSNGIHRFEGTINQYTGDGIMALFGAPIAHEDHAHRACYAALHLTDELAKYADELRRRRGLNFSVRIGINTGEVVVGRIGDDLRMDYTAQGHTVGLAARVEALAAPNAVYLSEHTAALVAGYFRLRELGDFEIKGVREPVALHQLEGVGSARSRLDISRSRGFSRFVGRASEMAKLDRALADAKAGKFRILGVVGEAGNGKSRLCYEFAERCRAEGIPVLEAHCVSHGQMIPFVPVLELLRNWLGVSELDDERVAREKIAGRLLLLDESFKDMLPLLFDFLGVPDPARPVPQMEPEQRRKILFQGLERMLECADDDQLAVILWEDLHWIDGASDTFLAGLIELLGKSGELLLVNTRPGYTAPWMALPAYEEISLGPLGEEAIDELLGDLLGPDESVMALVGRIRSQTAGNPFFIEEVVRAFVENGSLQGTRGAYRLIKDVEAVVIPATVHGVLAARIDRLSERDKSVLETAAVIGKRFSQTLLARVIGEAENELAASLSTLGDSGFIDEAQAYPEVEYAFHHPLTQEVAYRSQLATRRSQIHRQVAEALVAEACPKGDENAALVAHHWEGAGDTLNAVVWSRKAAEWATARDLAEARRHWLKVRELLDRCQECPESLGVAVVAREALIETGWKLGYPLESARELVEEGLPIADRAGDSTARARLMAAYAMAQLFAGRVEQGLADLERAAELARSTDDHDLNVNLHGRLAYMHLLAGHVVVASRLLDVAYELSLNAPPGSPAHGNPANAEWFRGFQSLPRTYLGDVSMAWTDLQRALTVVRAARDRVNECTMAGFAVTIAWFLGDSAMALTYARQQAAIAEKLGTPTLLSSAYDSLGVAYGMAERWAESVECTERALQNARQSGTLLQSEAVFVTNLAAAYLGSGKVNDARKLAREAVEVARRRSTPLFECRALLTLARSLLGGSKPEVDEAVAVLAEALAIVERTGARGYEPFLRLELARVAAARGDEIGRAREIAAAEKLFLAMGATAQVEKLRAAAERLAAS